MKIEYIDHFGSDLMVVNAARVSFNKWHAHFEPSDEKLISYLAREGHWSPFSHPQIQFRISVPIFVARQWFKHTVGTARNEVSRRYVDDSPDFFFPDMWRKRPEGNAKQGSSADGIEDQMMAYEILEDVIQTTEAAYNRLLELGVCPEQARMVLPQNMYTSWIETGSLYYWARVCNLRLDIHAQKEIRQAVLEIHRKVSGLFPISMTALVKV